MSSDATAGNNPAKPPAAGETAAELAAGVEARAEELAAEAAAKADDLAGETAARALELASALDDTLAKIAGRLDRYAVYGRRSRKIIIALAVSFALDIVITIVLGFTALSAHSTAAANASLVRGLHAAQLQLRAAQLESCTDGTVFRMDQDVVWQDFIHLITARPAPGTPESQIKATDKLAAGFLAYVSKVDRPVNCEALYGG